MAQRFPGVAGVPSAAPPPGAMPPQRYAAGPGGTAPPQGAPMPPRPYPGPNFPVSLGSAALGWIVYQIISIKHY